MKKLFLLLPTTLIMIFLLHINSLASETPRIGLFLDDVEITNLPEPPFMFENSVLVPAREIFESAGANVDWDPETKQVLILYNGSLLAMTLDEKTAWLDGRDIEMSVPPMIVNNKTMIPLRFPAECFNFGVKWVGEEHAAKIYTPQTPDVTDPSAEMPPAEVPPAIETPVTPPFEEIPSDTATENPSAELPSAESPPSVSDSAARDISPSEISAEQNAQVTILSLLTPKETGTAAYTATASGPISEVQKQLLPDNRLIIDITNSLCALQGPFYTDASVPVTEVRSSQFMDVPAITRIVFDLSGGAEYSVTLSPDRTRLTVSFTKNVITDVRFNSTGTSDSIAITGVSRPAVQMLPTANPDRFVIYISNAAMSQTGVTEVPGAYATRIESVQTDNVSARIEVSVKEWPSFEINEEGNTVTIRFFENTVLGVRYDYITKEIRLAKSPEVVFDINAIVHNDEYTKGLYTLTLPVDGESVWGYGEITARDNYIDTLKVTKNELGQTRIIIEEARVLAFTVSEDETSYIITPRLPKEVYKNIVLIDAGHGGSQPGNIHNGLVEKEFNLSVSLKLMELLNTDANIKAYATRLDDSYFELEERPYYANDIADLFVSIHANSFEGNLNANGTEIYYYPHDNDAWLGFSSKQFAEIMDTRFKSMLDIGHRGVKTDMYVVLHYTTIPAVLCELGFFTNQGDVAKLSDENFQWQIAYTIYYGIQDTFGVYKPAR